MKKILPGFILFVFFVPLSLWCDSGIITILPPIPEPEVNCRSAVLMDYRTGTILYAKNPDMAIPPASMTKLVTAYCFLKEIEQRGLDFDEIIPIGAGADYRNAPPHSSLMFLEEGQRVTARELVSGLTVPSGNDAAAAVAEYISGSIEAFASLMNSHMEGMGLTSTRFVEPSGYSEYNITTAGEFARFCREYIQAFPEISVEFSSLPSFTYPERKNLGDDGTSTLGPITQPNHNELIGRYAWADGLKTGYIEESGYNVALTAEKDGRRLICVIMGIDRKSGVDASLRRVADGVNLLSYGFYAFVNVTFPPPPLDALRVYRGEKRYISIAGDSSEVLTLKPGEVGLLERDFAPEGTLEAPVEKGDVVGVWTLRLEGEELGRYPVRAAETIRTGGFLKRLVGAVLLRLKG